MLKSEDLYPLIDALGFPVKLGRKNGDSYPLIGEAEAHYNGGGLAFDYKPTIVESVCDPYAMQTTGVRVALIGALQLVVTYDHKRLRLEAFVIDASVLNGKDVFGTKWSRLRFLFDIHKAVAAHFVYTDKLMVWQETPNAPRWVRDYLLAREQHKMTADDALEIADALAFGFLDREDPNLHANWKISTPAHRLEKIKEGAAKRAGVPQ
ncbi:MAG TPA: hypothetical protein VGD46_02250 [Rhizobacter sp.]